MNSHHNIISWQGQRFELKENLLAVLPLGKTLPFLCPDEQMHKFSVGQHKDTIAGCKTTPQDFSGAHWDRFCTLTGTEQGWNQGMRSLSMTHICEERAGSCLLHGTREGKRVPPHHQNHLPPCQGFSCRQATPLSSLKSQSKLTF